MAIDACPTFQGVSYGAFLFDMDGTLLDSSAVVERLWKQWSLKHGVDPDEVIAACHGVRANDLMERFAPPDVDIDDEVRRFHAEEIADTNGVVPILGVHSMIAALPPNRWAVVTSAPRALAETRLRAVGLPVPPVLIGAEDVAQGKPSPEGFLKAAGLLNVPIALCLAFEDSPAGIEAALSSCAKVVVVGDVACDRPHHRITDYRTQQISIL